MAMTDTTNPSNADLIRIPEAADRLGIRGRAVYELIDAGRLPGWKGRDGLMVTSARAVAELAGTDLSG